MLLEVLHLGRHLIFGQLIVCLHWLLLIWCTYLLAYFFIISDSGKEHFAFTLLDSNFLLVQKSYPNGKTHLTNFIGFSFWAILT